MQAGIMADNGETKHSFGAVCDMKGLHFFPLSLSLSRSFLFFYSRAYCEWLHESIACGGVMH